MPKVSQAPCERSTWTVAPSSTIKAVIERDYTCRAAIRFIEECPVRIETHIAREAVISTVAHINTLLAEAEQLTFARLLRNIANVLTLGILDTFVASPIDAAMAVVDAYVEQQNRAIFLPAGLRMHTPSSFGMLQIVIECL